MWLIVGALISAVCAALVQGFTGAPLRLLKDAVRGLERIPAWTVSGGGGVALGILGTLLVSHLRRSSRRRLGVRSRPGQGLHGLWMYPVLVDGVRWNCYLPLRQSYTLHPRPLEYGELAGLAVELPPRCPTETCQAELVEERRRWPRRGARWSCEFDGFTHDSAVPWVEVSEKVGRLARSEIAKLVRENRAMVPPI